MPTDVLMPALSPTIEEGRIARWLVTEGTRVRTGDVIAVVETDQATMELEAEVDGMLARIAVPAGSVAVKVATPIATIVAEPVAAHGVDAHGEGAVHGGPVAETRAAVITRVAATPEGAVNAMRCTDTDARVAVATLTQTIREALRDGLAEEMRRDGDVFVIGEGVASGDGATKVSEGLAVEFGKRRVVDTPVTEQGFAGLAVGAALAGLKPVVEFMSWSYALQAIDQIVNTAAKTHDMTGGTVSVPIVFRGPNGHAPRAGAEHSQCFAAWYAHIPGLKLAAPATAADAKGLLKAAIRDPGPVLLLESESLYDVAGPVPTDIDVIVPLGVARIARPGRDVTIVSYLRGVGLALAAAEHLASDGIDAEVIDLRSLRPLDMATVLASVARTNRIVMVEDSGPVCSIGSEICARVAIEAFDDLDAPPVQVSGADAPMPYAANLEAVALPTVERVVAACRSVCYVDR
ncbi:MAG: pyruvate dehydrogenase complex E1 component subunit beta [Hyphomicrobiaceae bacterium]